MHTLSVALIDNDPHIHRIATLLLAHHNISFEAFPSLSSAAEYLRTHKVDAIVVDLTMEGVSDRLAEVHNQFPGVHTIATTTNLLAASAIEELLAGFDGYILKPYSPESIANLLRYIVQRAERVA